MCAEQHTCIVCASHTFSLFFHLEVAGQPLQLHELDVAAGDVGASQAQLLAYLQHAVPAASLRSDWP